MAVKSSIAMHSKGLLSLFILLNLFVTHKCANQYTYIHTTHTHAHCLTAGQPVEGKWKHERNST